MVDKIKQNQPEGAPKLQQSSSTSTQSLKESFKSISSNVSVAQLAKQVSSGVKSSDEGAVKISNSLKDAVKYSRQALKVLEEVVAGDLSESDVNQLLSDSPVDNTVEIPKRERPVPVTELAGDLEALKNSLSNLFESLKNKADASEVYTENMSASSASARDLEATQSKAESTSMRIQFNAEEALSAHGSLNINSVSQLLASSEGSKA